MVGAFERKPNDSVRTVAKNLHKSKSFLQSTNTRTGLRSINIQKFPKNDETYVKADFSQIPENLYVAVINRLDVPKGLRAQKMSKFSKKFFSASALFLRKAEYTFRCRKHYEWTSVFRRVSPKAPSLAPEDSRRSNNLLAGFGIMPLHEGPL